ncbi:hypothetical protein AS156_30410 [Bradyrhizobium macuxiense]|uniref:Uncharacterized protein n=1 Tax=Bradyrhizobium macuxiense TaxID=1755647 RepID=A0A109K2P5_9BRAD|nr:hypothetical protein AS156_30410 [Bradyrhizobium macuxiense]
MSRVAQIENTSASVGKYGDGDEWDDGLDVTVGGASFVAYVIKRASSNRNGRRRGPAGSGANNSTSDPGGDSEGFGWLSSSSDSDHSNSCSAEGSSGDAGGGGDCGGGGDSGGDGSGD